MIEFLVNKKINYANTVRVFKVIKIVIAMPGLDFFTSTKLPISVWNALLGLNNPKAIHRIVLSRE